MKQLKVFAAALLLAGTATQAQNADQRQMDRSRLRSNFRSV